MATLLTIAGLVLLLAVSAAWATTVGWICVGAAALIVIIRLILFGVVGAVALRNR